MSAADGEIAISLVVPVYSGESYLHELVVQIDALRQKWSNAGLRLHISEAIFVLDSPIDDSEARLRALAPQYPWLRVVELSRNYGQHSATVAGILYSSGDWVVTLDEDLQHCPGFIEKLLQAACANAADVVYALPESAVHGGGHRDRLSRLAKDLIARLSGNRHVRTFNSFRLIRGDIARAASSICAQYTYFDVALTWFTQRIATVPLELSDDRYKSGERSGYRFWTLVQHAKRLVLTSDFRILRFTTALSLLTLLVAGAYGAALLYNRFISDNPVPVQGWTSLMLVILAFGAATVFMLGLILEFLHMGMLQLQGRPTFFVVNRSSDPLLAEQVARLGGAG